MTLYGPLFVKRVSDPDPFPALSHWAERRQDYDTQCLFDCAIESFGAHGVKMQSMRDPSKLTSARTVGHRGAVVGSTNDTCQPLLSERALHFPCAMRVFHIASISPGPSQQAFLAASMTASELSGAQFAAANTDAAVTNAKHKSFPISSIIDAPLRILSPRICMRLAQRLRARTKGNNWRICDDLAEFGNRSEPELRHSSGSRHLLPFVPAVGLHLIDPQDVLAFAAVCSPLAFIAPFTIYRRVLTVATARTAKRKDPF